VALDLFIEGFALSPWVICPADVYQVKQALRWASADAVFGSDLEAHLAQELGISFGFQIVSPVARFRTTDRAYMGYTGLLDFIDLC